MVIHRPNGQIHDNDSFGCRKIFADRSKSILSFALSATPTHSADLLHRNKTTPLDHLVRANLRH
jgi:hypothetical protein